MTAKTLKRLAINPIRCHLCIYAIAVSSYFFRYLLLNIAMGGVSGAIDPNFVESNMVIDYVRVFQNTGLSIDENFASKFSVYPNPTSKLINISSTEQVDRVDLFNPLGQIVLSKTNNVTKLNVENLKQGLYVLKLYSGDKSVTKKIIID